MNHPSVIQARKGRVARRLTPTPAVSAAQLQEHEDCLRQQYVRDLETLGRIEAQRGLDSDVDFFGAMGALHSGR